MVLARVLNFLLVFSASGATSRALGAACATRGVWPGMGRRSVVCVSKLVLLRAGSTPKKRFGVNKQFSGSCWEPPLIALLCAFQNECRKIWSLLRSGKFSCPTTREPFSSPNNKGDLNKCMMCQRLL